MAFWNKNGPILPNMVILEKNSTLVKYRNTNDTNKQEYR